jgi:hypothetical protein
MQLECTTLRKVIEEGDRFGFTCCEFLGRAVVPWEPWPIRVGGR